MNTGPVSKKAAREYHLICRTTGRSHGGFETLAGARQYAREEGLQAWDIFHGNLLVERHEPGRVEFTEQKIPRKSVRPLHTAFGVVRCIEFGRGIVGRGAGQLPVSICIPTLAPSGGLVIQTTQQRLRRGRIVANIASCRKPQFQSTLSDNHR
jgi:hypothetical protein